MLSDILKVFRRSVEAFREELATRDPEDQVAELLASMRRELVAARAAIPAYEAALKEARERLAHEERALQQCERRGRMAGRIGDEETVRIAAEFAAKHRERITVLQQKVAAAEAELDLRRREADEMKRRYQEADANRFALLARLRAASRTGRGTATDSGLFEELSRMEEKVEREASYGDALSELEDAPRAGERPDPANVEDRLRELKRQLGRDD